MKKLLRKSFLIGLGIASLTKRRAEKSIKKLVKKGLITKKDGDGLIIKMLVEANKERKRIEKFIAAEMKRELKKAKPYLIKARAEAKKKGMRAAGKAKSMAKKAAKKTLRRAMRKIR